MGEGSFYFIFCIAVSVAKLSLRGLFSSRRSTLIYLFLL